MSTPMEFPQLDGAYEEFSKVLGAENVLRIGDEAAERLRDHTLASYGAEREPIPSGAVLPGTVEELQAILKIANGKKVPLWTISLGRNYGYGGPAPVKSGCVTLDLRRMNRIIEINPELAYAVVEPGVTPEMLWAEIRARGLDRELHMDSASSPWGSLLGNAVDRGGGYSVMASRVDALCGMEVALPDGELIRTGTGGLPNSATWHTYKHGYGPALDGLFHQSNFGVVTKAGIHLFPRPPSFRHAEVYISGLDDRVEFVDTLRRLQLNGIIDNGISGGTNYGGHIEGAIGPGGGIVPPPPDMPPGMRARLAFRGTAEIVDAKWRAANDALSELAGYSFNSARYDAPYDYADWTSEACLAAGIPTSRELTNWDNAHYLIFASLLIPATGKAYGELCDMASGIFESHGRIFRAPGFHMHVPRTMVCLISAPLRGNHFVPPEVAAAIDNDESEEIIREVITEGAKHGWIEYRTGTPFMDLVRSRFTFNDGALPRLQDRLKDFLDPAGILSPGKSGIWPGNS